ncbi:hypothetical protein D3C85_955370 [compost metagenome]
MAKAHDLVDGAIFQGRPGRQLQALWQGFMLDHQRVITGDRQRMVEAGEHAFVFVGHRAGLAVHHLAGAHHIAAERLADRLMAQAYTENRQLAGEVLDCLNGNTGLGGCARAWRYHDTLGVEGFDFSYGQFVVADHFDVRTQLTKVLNDVVGKRVVIVDHQ